MTNALIRAEDAPAETIPVHLVGADELETILSTIDVRSARFARAQGFKAEAGRHVIVPDEEGNIGAVLLGLGPRSPDEAWPLLTGKLAAALPAGTYRIASAPSAPDLAALALAVGGYRFDRYRKAREGEVRFVLPEGADDRKVRAIAGGIILARDLINTPANDMAPLDLAKEAIALAERHGAKVSLIEGEALARDFPMVHAVGESSDRPPCLVDFVWGPESGPKITLVGKGVVFDTGGLDIKPASAMAMMKKDMGGAANVLGLASMIMSASLRVRLRVIVPCVENAISGRAFRPGDVLRSRKGLTVEIGNTDAEGRLILADGLALGDEEAPDLMVTMSTLTGAARTALGPEIPPFYTNDDDFAEALAAASAAVHDPIWRMPLWKPYDAWLTSKVADVNHISNNAFAGSIVAALFLRRFVSQAKIFAHFDIYAWSPAARPLGPEGGEAQAIRALFHHLSKLYG